MRLALAQIDSGTDIEHNLALVRAGFAEAAARGADLVCFPEYTMYEKKAVDETFQTVAQPVDGPFALELAALAGDHGIAVIAGIVEAHPLGARPFNSLVGFDADGAPAGVYRKIHLYDAYGFRESQWISRPDPPQPVVMPVGGARVGVMTCNDLRYPALSAQLAATADLLLVCASWVPGPQKVDQWRTLASARAIENVITTAGVCQAPPVSIGTSLVVEPMGAVVAELGTAPGMLVVDVDVGETARARARAAQ